MRPCMTISWLSGREQGLGVPVDLPRLFEENPAQRLPLLDPPGHKSRAFVVDEFARVAQSQIRSGSPPPCTSVTAHSGVAARPHSPGRTRQGVRPCAATSPAGQPRWIDEDSPS